MLVDDDAELASLLSEFLRREGFSVDAAHEGNRGLEKALMPDVDLVVLDVMLPGIDGFEILRRLRQKSKVPVLMLTAESKREQIVEAAQAGVSGYVIKPFTAVTLKEKIDKILESRAA